MKFQDVKPGTIFIADDSKYYIKTTGEQNGVKNEAVLFRGLVDMYDFDASEEVYVVKDM